MSENRNSSKENPSAALHQLLSPDGYYTYLNIPIPNRQPEIKNGVASGVSEIDIEAVKKNYRRLSLKHHPDRRGGDAETFRVLNRAKKVLTTPKLRKQYDLIGLDLHDEQDEDSNNDDNGNSSASPEEDGDGDSSSSSPDSVINQIASVTIASILQVVVRTALMGLSATFVSRFKLTLFPLVLFLGFVAYRVKTTSGTTLKEVAVPILIALGITFMHFGRARVSDESNGNALNPQTFTWRFLIGEMLTIIMFITTSIPANLVSQSTALINVVIFFVSLVLAYMLKGRFWRYTILTSFELGLALLAAIIFPIMEMILEEIVNEKMRKVGEKVRAQAKRMDDNLRSR